MSDPGHISVHRASLLRELLAPLPKAVLHANKQLTSIKEFDNSKIEVKFQDGVIEYFDAVIGADGVYSTIRRYVLQDATDQHQPTPAGFWDCRVLTPIEKAKAVLDSNYLEERKVYTWLGDGASILHGIIENGTLLESIISGAEKDPAKDRKRPLQREYLNSALSRWLDGPIATGIINVSLPVFQRCTRQLILNSWFLISRTRKAILSGSISLLRPIAEAELVLSATPLMQHLLGRQLVLGKH